MTVLINSLWIFSIFSFLGWLCLFVSRSIKERKITNPGFITLPFSIGSGLFSVIIYLVYGDWYNLPMVFFGSIILINILYFFACYIIERFFKFKWKDYSKKKWKLNNYVSLFDAVSYGVISVVLVFLCFEPIENLASALPFWVSLLIPAIITGLALADFIITLVTIYRLNRNLKQMQNISSLIEESTSEKTDDELRVDYENRMVKDRVFRNRLVKAFPDLYSVNYQQQLDEIKNRFDVVRKKNEEVYNKTYENEEDKPFAYGLGFSKLFWLFLIGCVAGTVLETIWALCTLGRLELRVGMVVGPFIPVYGGGAVLITLCLYRLHKVGDLWIYLASGVIGATFEYFCSYFQEKLLGTVSWDYSDTPFNIDGRTNLMFGLIWGLLGLFWLRYLYPTLCRWIEKMPKKLGKKLTVIFAVFLALDGALSMLAVYRMEQRNANNPPQTAVGQCIDTVFNDDYMHLVFPHMCKPEDWGKDVKTKSATKNKI